MLDVSYQAVGRGQTSVPKISRGGWGGGGGGGGEGANAHLQNKHWGTNVHTKNKLVGVGGGGGVKERGQMSGSHFPLEGKSSFILSSLGGKCPWGQTFGDLLTYVAGKIQSTPNWN